MKVPRPSGGSRQAAGVGKIFVKFEDNEAAGKALRTLAGRKFADRTVVTTYFSEVRGSIYLFSQIVADISSHSVTGKLRGQRLVDLLLPSLYSVFCHTLQHQTDSTKFSRSSPIQEKRKKKLVSIRRLLDNLSLALSNVSFTCSGNCHRYGNALATAVSLHSMLPPSAYVLGVGPPSLIRGSLPNPARSSN